MKDKETRVTLRMGEKQLSNTSAVKTYFSGRTHTGLDIPISRLKGLSREWSRTGESTESLFPSRHTVSSFLISQKCTLKMFSIYTSIGSRKAYAEIFLNVDPKAPKIIVTGWHGFGEFIGHAYIATPKEQIPEGIEIKTLAAGADSEEQATGLIF